MEGSGYQGSGFRRKTGVMGGFRVQGVRVQEEGGIADSGFSHFLNPEP
jgi:hypothetical protein